MTINEEIKKAKNLVFNGKLKTAIEKIDKTLNSEKDVLLKEDYDSLSNELTLISMGFKDLQKFERTQTKSEDLIALKKKNLALSLLKTLDEIAEKIPIDFSISNLTYEGLKLIDPDEGMELACESIKNARSIRIIGAGRQDIAETPLNSYITDYYNAIQNRLSNKSDEAKPVLIRRVTQHILKDEFKNHLKTCYEVLDESENTNRFEVVLYGNLRIAYTYVIVDLYEKSEPIMFLTLQIRDNDRDLIDTALVFYTNENSIIRKFKLHFDQFWGIESKRGRVIKSLHDFEDYIPFDDKLYKKYNEVKNFVKRIPNNSIRMNHLEYEINLFHKRLSGLDNCKLLIHHTRKNERLSYCFYWYVSILKTGMSYKTVSIDKFWYSLYNMEKFLEKQEMALLKGALIERIYLVDNKKIDNSEYFEKQQRIIYKNIIQHEKHEKYTFSILFINGGQESETNRNFAIWSDDNKNYQVVSLLNHGQKEPQTYVYFINRPKTIKLSSLPHVNEGYLDEATNQFNYKKQLVQSQNKALLKFIEKGATNSDYDREIKFLKKCGIPNVETYLKNCM